MEWITQQKRILIIDDELDVTITLRVVLEHYGFMTDSYNDPVLAYKNFRDGLYDLVLLDIKMPVVDGFLLYHKIRRTDSSVKICFLVLRVNTFMNRSEKKRDSMVLIKNYS